MDVQELADGINNRSPNVICMAHRSLMDTKIRSRARQRGPSKQMAITQVGDIQEKCKQKPGSGIDLFQSSSMHL